MRMKKILLFNYFLQKCAIKVQSLFSIEDNAKASQLGVIASKTRMFRRTSCGCSMEEIYFCNPMYAQELFLYFCYRLGDKGDKLLSYFDFHRFISYLPGFYSVECYEDKDITYHLEKIYPVVSYKHEIEFDALNKILGEHTQDDFLLKFHNISNFRGVKPLYKGDVALKLKEKELMDNAWADIENDSEFIRMLNPSNKHDHNGRSYAYNAYFNKMKI